MITTPAGHSLGLRDEALDESPILALAVVPGAEPPRSRRWRRLLHWSATSAPVALLLLTGLALGRHGINLLSINTLSLLAPAIPVALAALGVLVGLSVGGRRLGDRRFLAAAVLASAVTLLVVSAGLALLALAGWAPVIRPFWTVVVAAGLCAATSLTLPTGNAIEPRTPAARLLEFGVLLPIVVGGVLLAALRGGSTVEAVILLAQASGLTVTLAAAVWLLLSHASSATEGRVLIVSALLMVGGVADALSMSALFSGTVAGVVWRVAGRHPPETIGRDILFAQHPLLVWVLLAAGASAALSPGALALGAAYLALRVAGQLAGGLLGRRVAGLKVPLDVGLHLLPPGVFGVAFALNAAVVIGEDAAVLLAAVVVGTIGSELVAFLLPSRRVDA
jgi:hypothetical protein